MVNTPPRRSPRTRAGRTALLVLLATGLTSRETLEVVFQSRSDPDVYRVPTGPTGCLTTLSGSDTFPTQLWSVDPIEHLPGIRPSSAHGGSALATTWTLRVGLGQWPLLLWSSMPLELRSVTVLGTV
ncbi:hypothetical protein L6R53_20260 [Myxococcota bacterium]|nr:hypothetical protein [Myxococcota bacterium]